MDFLIRSVIRSLIFTFTYPFYLFNRPGFPSPYTYLIFPYLIFPYSATYLIFPYSVTLDNIYNFYKGNVGGYKSASSCL